MEEIIKYTLPSAVIGVLIYVILNRFFNQQLALKNSELKNQQLNTLLPSKLQAYERLVIFLERSNPASLILRVYKMDMTVAELQSVLINTLKSEFDHNLAQQLFVSNEAWEITRNAKEEMVKFVMTTALGLAANDEALLLSKRLVEIASSVDKLPTQIALDFVKKEAQSFVSLS